jgi:predicted nuclease of predicted toxin-antitoxin system
VIRFHLDENVDHAIARGLRQRGIDVTTASDANLMGASDPAQLSFAASEHRVVFTHDHDFLRLHSSGATHHGIVYTRSGDRSIGEIVRFLKLMCDCLDSDEMIGQLEFM